MYNYLVKNGQAVAFGIGLVCVLLFLITAFNGGAGDLSSLPIEQQRESNAFNFGIKMTQFLIGFCIFLVLAFGIMAVVNNPKGSLYGIVALIVIVVIFFVFMNTAPDVPEGTKMYKTMAEDGVTQRDAKIISGEIGTALLLLGVAVLSMIVFEVRNLFK